MEATVLLKGYPLFSISDFHLCMLVTVASVTCEQYVLDKMFCLFTGIKDFCRREMCCP